MEIWALYEIKEIFNSSSSRFMGYVFPLFGCHFGDTRVKFIEVVESQRRFIAYCASWGC
jgi:hypothetical protein